ncbi:hypothetical protein PIB30_086500 [Stylosanthes scabra]|uniref:Uncharacterized protein n=1 Tax=Stylosanthes scabra TaxID=79078 RepID=A0ABU6VRL1_9FABA|nr:hypothetical protein [Stylosanthes scabra]
MKESIRASGESILTTLDLKKIDEISLLGLQGIDSQPSGIDSGPKYFKNCRSDRGGLRANVPAYDNSGLSDVVHDVGGLQTKVPWSGTSTGPVGLAKITDRMMSGLCELLEWWLRVLRVGEEVSAVVVSAPLPSHSTSHLVAVAVALVAAPSHRHRLGSLSIQRRRILVLGRHLQVRRSL